MPTITLFHNPACSHSRNALALLRHAGLEPTIVEYLKTPLTAPQLKALFAATGQPVRALLRSKESVYAEQGLDEPHWTDDALLDVVAQHPVLMNRPIVQTPQGTRLCRPAAQLLELLPVGPLPPFTQSDGTVVHDNGQRLT